MFKKIYKNTAIALFSLVLALAASSPAFGAVTIAISNNDGPNEGFNDPTPVAPVGGNSGTTLGQQRLNAFQAAAIIWGATLTSSVTIVIRANFDPLTCNATNAVLGSAGPLFLERDFVGAPFAATWYHEALGEKLFGGILTPSPDIGATFNTNLGQAGCLTGTFFYLGLDNNHGANVDLVTVLLHEFGHGLGFSTTTSSSTGVVFMGFPSVYDRFLVDNSTGESWIQMTNAERQASAIGVNRLAWNGPLVEDNALAVLNDAALVRINSPAGIAGNFQGGAALFGPALTSSGVTGNVVQAVDPADGAGPLTTDGCSALTNAGAVAGNIAIIDRGTCGFPVKVLNAQNAGAIGVIIVDNVTGQPPAPLGGVDGSITIPSERVTFEDGATIKANLPGVNATLRSDPTLAQGADFLNKLLMFSPNPVQGGSSVSHWNTTTFPNQLMEPAINGDLTHNVITPSDLSFSQLTDIGWVATALPSRES